MTVGSKVKRTLSSLRGVEGTIRMYAEQSQDEEVETSYREALEIIEEVIRDMEKRVAELELEEPQYKGF